MIKKESIIEYHNNPAISRSRLFNIKKSPAYYKWSLDNPKESADLTFGKAFHKWVLEQDDFYNEFAVSPKFNRATKQGKQDYLDFMEANIGKVIINEEEFEKIQAMRESIMQNPYAKQLLKNGEAETSFYWTDELTGLECKCRPDYLRDLGNKKVLIDLKSCQDADLNKIIKDSIAFGYDMQTAMYIDGISKEYNIPKSDIIFIFIFVSKSEPYLVNVAEANDEFKEYGEANYREMLGRLKECQETNNWYGFNGIDNQPNELGLPAYLKKKVEE